MLQAASEVKSWHYGLAQKLRTKFIYAFEDIFQQVDLIATPATARAELHAAISPDGKSVAFSASYEGPTEVYVISIEGGQPQRLTYDGESARVVGWTPDGRVCY